MADDAAWATLRTPEAVSAALQQRCEDPQCQHAHLIAYTDRFGNSHVIGPPPPEPPPLAVELRKLYPRHCAGVESWPAPDDLNPPLERPASTAALPEKMAHAVLLRNPELAPSAPLPDDPVVGAIVAPAAPTRRPTPRISDFSRYPPLPLAPDDAHRRFFAKVMIVGECWLWTGARVKNSTYGAFGVDGRVELAHRWAWEEWIGDVPEGHRLTRRPGCPKHCCQPSHWRPERRAAPAVPWVETPPIPVPEVRTTGGRRLCGEPGCDRPHVARGRCMKHYDAVRIAARRRTSVLGIVGPPLGKSARGA